MSEQARYDAIHQIERLAADQGLTYSYDNGIVTFHTQAGDETFFWNEGMPAILHTLQWLEGRKNVMSQFEQIPARVKQQYISLYGEYVPGEYPIGSLASAPGVQGEIIWSFRPGGNGMHTYVIAPAGGFPVEVAANEVKA